MQMHSLDAHLNFPCRKNGADRNSSGGCNPMNIDYEVIDSKLTIKTADFDNYADKFASWGGPVE